MRSLLPEELTVDIFTRLPAKSVGWCRCLSKSWRTLLSDPQFGKTHLNQTLDHPKLSFLIIAACENYIWSASFDNAHQLFEEITVPAKKLNLAGLWLDAYASCHGLVLVGDIDQKKFVLNPVTREIRRIPDSPFFLEPDESFIMHGFGYDSVNNDYLVVTISRYDTENGYGFTTDNEGDSDYCPDMLVNVYSMKCNTWEKVDISPYYIHRVVSGVFLNGCIHWVGEVESSGSAEFVVVVFDLAGKKFTEMKPPSSFVHQRVYDSSLVVLDGCLSVYRDDGFVVWVMKEYGVQESWTSFTINDLGVCLDDTWILCMLGKEEIVLSADCGRKTIVYNLKHGSFKDVVFSGIRHDLFARTSFVESLISPYTLQ